VAYGDSHKLYRIIDAKNKKVHVCKGVKIIEGVIEQEKAKDEEKGTIQLQIFPEG
jgi:hypothetical protein